MTRAIVLFGHGSRDPQWRAPMDEVARRIRASADSEKLCLIAVTGYGLPADQEQARQAGFNFHLVKPVHPSQINTLLRNLGTA